MFVKFKEEIDQNLQNQEVSRWWNHPRNIRWDNFYYSDENKDKFHVWTRMQKSLDYLDSLSLPNGSKVLELGFGGGQMANEILSRGFQYTGIDISEQLCEAATKRSIEYVEENLATFQVGSIEEDYSFKDEYFDVVMVCGALQYLGDPNKCFNEVNRVLKDNGHFIVCQSNMYSMRTWRYPRKAMLSLVNFIVQDEFLVSPCFKSILTETKLKKYFNKYQDSSFMNSKFMTKGYDKWEFKIKKRLYSYSRLKKMLISNGFKKEKACGATFVFPKNNLFKGISSTWGNLIQVLSDFKVIPYLFTFADNVIILSSKKKNS
jgi:ubiquinone/menaquinone biosynthesis C-methylase UbiE